MASVRRRNLVILALGGICLIISPLRAASFQVLGFLPGGSASEARAVSADGSVIVGSSGATSGHTAFRWTVSGSMVGLPKPEGLSMSWATDVSSDGSFVVGYAGDSFQTPVGWEGFRWNVSGVLDRIAAPGAGVWAKGVSGDGLIVVGSAADEAFTWTSGGGLVGLGGLNEGEFRSGAEGISADGRVVVGYNIDIDVVQSVRDTFRWTEDDGMVGLGAFTAVAASNDGSVVVGCIDNGEVFEAFRWTSESGVVPLGTYGQDNHTRATGVSADGSIVLGYVQSDIDDSAQAFIWDAEDGMRLLKDVLENDYGLDLGGHILTRAWAMSDDGLTIVGGAADVPYGQQEAWRAVIPEPATLIILATGLPALISAKKRPTSRNLRA